MRTFEHFPKDKQCPVCGTSKDRETVLVPIYGTSKGGISQAICVHADCIIDSIVYYKTRKMIATTTTL